MSHGALRCRFAAWVAIAAALIFVGVARAEFTPGVMLPEFSLKASDGSVFSLSKERDSIVVKIGADSLTPKVLLVHLFQPDCLQCQAQMQALEGLHQELSGRGVLVVGIAHRGDLDAVRAIAHQLNVTFPLLLGTGSEVAQQFAAGDTMAIADNRGIVQFAQVGYGQGDEKVWRDDIGLLLAGKPVRTTSISRERLRVGDRLPLIELPLLTSGKTVALTGEGGRLTYRDDSEGIHHPKAVVGMFSRY
jgi:peroxiredoxin